MTAALVLPRLVELSIRRRPRHGSSTWFVGDLHLDVGRAGPRHGATAFAEFLRTVVQPDRSSARRLVLLGDVVELSGIGAEPGRREDWALGRLERLAPATTMYRKHFGGGRVRSPLAGTLTTGDGQVRVHSWAVHEHQLLPASHGHQHHDLNRLPTLLAAVL